MKPKCITKRIDRESYSEFYITVESPLTGAAREQTGALYQEVIPFLKENKIQIIQEKVHGSASVLNTFREERERLLEEAGMDCSLPLTFVEGRPLDGQEIVSLQIWGIAAMKAGVLVEQYVGPETPARVFRTPDFELLYCPQVHGIKDLQAQEKPNLTVQCEVMFDRCTAALDCFGVDFKAVARTWIYARRLLDWYGELNRVRTGHFRKAGIFSTGKDPVYPASTGIQGRFSDEECFLDLLAVKSKNNIGIRMIPVVTTSRQCQAFEYGSAFSRGMILVHEGYRSVYVSGTASINTAGESTYIGDPEMQSLDTLMNIAALLEDQGGSLADVTTGVVYCKNPETYQAYKRVLRLLRIPDLPLVCVEADVCRHELLIEIELVAVIEESV